MTQSNFKSSTLSVHAGSPGDKTTGAVTTPIYTSSVYAQQSPGVCEFEYGRVGNPTRFQYEKAVAELERAEKAFAFASGVAAINAVIDILSAGSHIIAIDVIYGGTYRIFEEVKRKTSNHEISYINFDHIDSLQQSLQKNTRMVWLETPANPLLNIVDIEKISRFCKQNNLILVVDNTFATPYNQNPILLGADIVVHSASKYINGHSDVISGIIAVSDESLIKQIEFVQLAGGAVAGPFDSFLAARGLKTLALRMEKHNQNALNLAEWLEEHTLVKSVHYPGLKSSIGYEIAQRQMTGFGGVIALELQGTAETARVFLESLKLFSITVSVGGVESLSSIPALMSHSSIPKEIREKHGISDTLVRLSIGIEDVEDLQSDIEQALIKATQGGIEYERCS
ncbi:PLP-dependent transferase [Francisella sp. Scap27]|uniref:trans-sulfuration enzyme family protein n=1 Tax=Francisella sp. Scap27 TaxID=2589986 RepID=UPI0015C04331|nr:PLP-dependent aspartate aminotransferase family protein [Francisella sp. Scap27]QLE79411.1 PLP-dependent transferase [Francisella sp. Scap27]